MNRPISSKFLPGTSDHLQPAPAGSRAQSPVPIAMPVAKSDHRHPPLPHILLGAGGQRAAFHCPLTVLPGLRLQLLLACLHRPAESLHGCRCSGARTRCRIAKRCLRWRTEKVSSPPVNQQLLQHGLNLPQAHHHISVVPGWHRHVPGGTLPAHK